MDKAGRCVYQHRPALLEIGRKMTDLLRRESRLRSPLASLLADGEKWMVGFDDVFNRLVERWEDGFDGFHEYPASNIKKITEDQYRIEVSVAGFKREDLKIELEDETLVITGTKKEETQEEKADYLQRGFKERSFKQSFQLTEHDRVLDANLRNGILEIDIKREAPMPKRRMAVQIRNS
jgi:molecular chaperone IbpA